VGRERARGLYALRWVVDAGIPLAAGSDLPVDDESPLMGLYAAITRQDARGQPPGGWHPEQRLTLEEALRAYTLGAAYAAFEDDRKGRIAPGYWADLTVLSRDLRLIPASEIPRVEVVATIVGGVVAHERLLGGRGPGQGGGPR
jgi:predicted amidohydrolase YtcJ